MGKRSKPRAGSMQFWPRKRSETPHARVRSWAPSNTNKPQILGFAGYKAGMTHVLFTDEHPNSPTKTQEVSVPATIIECPPIKVMAIRSYKKGDLGLEASVQVLANEFDKELSRLLPPNKGKGKKSKIEDIKLEETVDIRLLVHTQPGLTGIGKKKPDVFEIGIGGKTIQDKLDYAKGVLGTAIDVKDAIAVGSEVDIHAVTKGKGFQGPVKRFGIAIRQAKSEKSIRNPGSLGPWKSQGKIQYRVAHAGQMGYHQRKEFNKWVLKVGNEVADVNQDGGIKHYGEVKSSFILLKGSVAGPAKRIIKMSLASRPNRDAGKEPTITSISTSSKQGR
ncbi:MAG: 50S ribosomal protein L3 [archaeon]